MLRFVADFETTNDINDCRVWGGGICEIPGSIDSVNLNIEFFNSIEAFFGFLSSQKNSHEVYFHNLKFDAQFLIHELLRNGFTYDEQLKEAKTFRTLITSTNTFYSIEICWFAQHKKNGKNKKTGEQKWLTKRIVSKVLDSYKKIPLSVEKMAGAFGLDIAKGSIDYNAKREIGHELTEDEKAYIRNDVEIVARSLAMFVQQGFTKMTLSADAMASFKQSISGEVGEKADRVYRQYFPKLSEEQDAWVRKAYKGGLVQIKKGEEQKIHGQGMTLDVNSLYPSVMRYAWLPYGAPITYNGFYYDDANARYHQTHPLFIQEFICSFKLKENRPAVCQQKAFFKDIEYLEEGFMVHLHMTSIDLEIFFDCYDVYDFRPIGGMAFRAHRGFFDNYVDGWMNIKEEATRTNNKAMRSISKLFANSLFGKFSVDSKSFINIPYIDEKTGIVKYRTVEGQKKEVQYTAMSAFITSYARQTLVRAMVDNWERLIYVDTDSIHLKGWERPNLYIDEVALGAWKIEGYWEKAKFIRSKSYLESYVHTASVDATTGEIELKRVTNEEDLTSHDLIEELEVKCSGMTEEVKQSVTFENFNRGATYEGKKLMRTVAGGRVIEEVSFTIH